MCYITEEAGEGVGFSLKQNSGRSCYSPVELTDMEFADEITLLSDNMADTQQLSLGGWIEDQQEEDRVHEAR